MWEMYQSLLLLLLVLTSSMSQKTVNTKPHIIIIMADDMGFNDVGFHGSNEIPTPNIDALASFGIALNRYYVAPMCTPSRSTLMTGKYPSHVGMQHYVIDVGEPWALGLNEKLLPEYMRDAGYRTHLVGKWHLGIYMKRYTPTRRGFDSHFGYLGPYIDYYNHSLSDRYLEMNGHDMRSNLSSDFASTGTYATDLFSRVAVETIAQHPKHLPMFMLLSHLAPHTANNHDPLQVPDDELTQFAYIAQPKRRKYAAMVSRLDAGIGRVVEALHANQMLQNSVILFFSDNGAPVEGELANSGSNYPLRGQKNSPWEGAIRSAAAIWSPLLTKRQRASQQLFHISDWLPTFAHLAGVRVEHPVDGHNIWAALSDGTPSPRDELLCHMDQLFGFSALIRDEWKLVNGTTSYGLYDGWLSQSSVSSAERQHPSFFTYGDSVVRSPTGRVLRAYENGAMHGGCAKHVEALRTESAVQHCQDSTFDDRDGSVAVHDDDCQPFVEPCLFNVLRDPCERHNLAAQRPDVVRSMMEALGKYKRSALVPRNRPTDVRTDPKRFNGTWTWWYDELGIPDDDRSSGQRDRGFNVLLAIAIGLLFVYASDRLKVDIGL